MKHFTKILAAVLMLVTAASAQADLFNCTNTFNNTVAIIGWPTNTIGTNNIGGNTGGWIDMRWNDTAGFYYSGYATTQTGFSNQTAKLTFLLVKSWSDSPPVQSTTNTTWQTQDTTTLNIYVSAAGPVYWGTNLSAEVISRANWIGLYQVTNDSPYFAFTNRAGAGPGLNLKVNGVRLR